MCLKDGQSRRLEKIRARVKPTKIPAKVIAHRACRSAYAAVFMAEAKAVTTAAMAKVASNISKTIEAAHKVLERPSNPVHACPAESLAIGPRTAKPYLQRFPSPLCQNISHQETRRPSDTRLNGTGHGLAE